MGGWGFKGEWPDREWASPLFGYREDVGCAYEETSRSNKKNELYVLATYS